MRPQELLESITRLGCTSRGGAGCRVWIPCSRSKGISGYRVGVTQELEQLGAHDWPDSAKFPVLSLQIRDLAAETSSPATLLAATESAEAETFPEHQCPDRENHAIPRGFGRSGLVNSHPRRRVRGSMHAAARVYLRCRFRQFGLVVRLDPNVGIQDRVASSRVFQTLVGRSSSVRSSGEWIRWQRLSHHERDPYPSPSLRCCLRDRIRQGEVRDY
jgi:hypothetical protein